MLLDFGWQLTVVTAILVVPVLAEHVQVRDRTDVVGLDVQSASEHVPYLFGRVPFCGSD